ncbi:hypothetical protein CBOM_04817 [Ceraceosorus bombacis]|uniref:Uncharacterized protein n=1 Tax=Ceraceosorus bombacis TaxID=401625 RepID=A0A0P1BNE4_9BASI|nr:hypothetical protein CBOM_04817 [Ceraceosorus bombacis]
MSEDILTADECVGACGRRASRIKNVISIDVNVVQTALRAVWHRFALARLS